MIGWLKQQCSSYQLNINEELIQGQCHVNQFTGLNLIGLFVKIMVLHLVEGDIEMEAKLYNVKSTVGHSTDNSINTNCQFLTASTTCEAIKVGLSFFVKDTNCNQNLFYSIIKCVWGVDGECVLHPHQIETLTHMVNVLDIYLHAHFEEQEFDNQEQLVKHINQVRCFWNSKNKTCVDLNCGNIEAASHMIHLVNARKLIQYVKLELEVELLFSWLYGQRGCAILIKLRTNATEIQVKVFVPKAQISKECVLLLSIKNNASLMLLEMLLGGVVLNIQIYNDNDKVRAYFNNKCTVSKSELDQGLFDIPEKGATMTELLIKLVNHAIGMNRLFYKNL